MYKDKDKQREAVKEATRRYRAKRPLKNARGCIEAGEVGDTHTVIPYIPKPTVIPENYEVIPNRLVIPCDTQSVIPPKRDTVIPNPLVKPKVRQHVRSIVYGGELTKERQVSRKGFNE